jgi:DNA-binding transcriptional LysR family regulator
VELRQLRYFVALAEELHFGAAATRLRVSKATLSQQIRVLERSLGVALLIRERQRVRLSVAGETLLVEARALLLRADNARFVVATASYPKRPVDLRVAHGVEHTLTRQLACVHADAALLVNLSVTGGMDAEAAVASGRADAAVTWAGTSVHTTLHEQRIGATPVSLAVPSTHRLAALDVVPVSALHSEKIALFPRRIAPRLWQTFIGHLLPDGPEPDQVLEEQTSLIPMMGMLRAVEQGRGVTPFVHAVAEVVAPDGVELRPLSPALELPIHLVSREPHRPELRRLATLLSAP